MDRRFRNIPFISELEEPEVILTENGPDSPSSGDDSKMGASPSSKKSKRGGQKRVVSVPIGDVEGSKSKGETYPPSDSWAWRKYGQKPIKGSPYPRGYYRCSSTKGCPARKQVERSRMDPTKLIITYAFEHNHPLPTKSHNQSSATTLSTPSATSDSSAVPATPESLVASPVNELAFFPRQTGLELSDDSAAALLHNHHWFDDVASMTIFESPICTRGTSCFDIDSTMFSSRGWEEEDESMFADLGELPECSVVFQRRVMEPEEQNRTRGLSAVPCCGSTG